LKPLLPVPGVGGIKRYEDDTYIGGNPWILTTLWLCHYKIKLGHYEKARELLDWAVEHRTEMGLLPEQIDKHTGETAWVVPLTWSHAMFILAISLLAQHEQLSSLQAETI
jgi:glucoamylase